MRMVIYDDAGKEIVSKELAPENEIHLMETVAEQRQRLAQARKALDVALKTFRDIEVARHENAVSLVKNIKAMDLETPCSTIVAACTTLDGPPPGFRGAWA